MSINDKLNDFTKNNRFSGKGPLCVGLAVTNHAIKYGLPINPDDLLTKSGGQVSILGKPNIQSILKKFGIERTLAEEGGRTSRGSIDRMRKYVKFLNELNEENKIDILLIEEWWIEKINLFFAGKPFNLNYDLSKSLRFIVKDLLLQAEKRQKKSSGSTYVGAMLQHLVGAKLNLLIDYEIKHYGYSVADKSSGREGDFHIEDVSIHVTTTPTESLIKKCRRNIENGLKPFIISISKGVIIAEGLAENEGIDNRVDIFEAEQFIAGNLYEMGKFNQSGRKTTIEELIKEYNQIIQGSGSLSQDVPFDFPS